MNIGGTTSNSRLFSWLPYLAIGLAGAALAAYATTWGPWTFSDGVGYMVSAKNLIDGPGLGLVKFSGEFEPLISHPPAYPLLIAGLYRLGLPLVEAARWIDIAVFGLFTGLIPALYAKLTRSSWSGMTVGILFLTIPAVALHFLGAISEPGFLTTGFAGLLATAEYIQSKRAGWIWLAAGLLAVSVLFRYPALAFVASACALLLLTSEAPWRTRARRALALGAGTIAPTVVFLIYSLITRAAAAPRAIRPSLGLVRSTLSFARALGKLAWEWKPIPSQTVLALFLRTDLVRPLQLAIATLLGIAVAALVAVAFRRFKGTHTRSREDARPILPIALGLTALVYLGFLYVAYLITYPTPDLDQRTMLPLLITLVFAAIEAIRWSVSGASSHSRWPIAAAVLLLASTIAGLAPSSIDIYHGLHHTGLGYTGEAWRRSPTLAAASDIPTSTRLASNAPEAILLYTNRYPFSVANLEASVTCPADIAELTKEGLVIVSFDPEALDGARKWDAASVRSICKLDVIAEWDDGFVMGGTSSW